MRFLTYIFSVLIFAVFLMGCGSSANEPTVATPSDTTDFVEPTTAVELQYAQGFKIEFDNGFKKVTVNDPWTEGGVRGVYLLVPKTSEVPERGGVTIVRTPVESMIPFSTTHIGFMALLEVETSIVAVFDGKWVSNEFVTNQIRQQLMPEVGGMDRLDFERTVLLNPDLVMVSGLEEMGANYHKLAATPIPVIQNMEWMESHPLARAEWIKFVAAFYDQEALADSIFAAVAAEYQAVSEQALASASKPLILCSKSYQDTWFMPGGKSHMAKLLVDAGGDYPWLDNDETGSLRLSPEAVIEKQLMADIWMSPEIESLENLAAVDSRYANFKAFQNAQVYGNNKRTNPEGGNDFWETGTARPDLVLKDLVKIFHPELLTEYETTFYQLVPKTAEH
jgi:iron complex transport system substrate-binding protein